MISLEKLKTTVAAIISLGSYCIGTYITKINMILPKNFCQDTFDRVLQEIAWIIAIVAGTISIINGVINWFKNKKNDTE